jgi:hypothetical protein
MKPIITQLTHLLILQKELKSKESSKLYDNALMCIDDILRLKTNKQKIKKIEELSMYDWIPEIKVFLNKTESENNTEHITYDLTPYESTNSSIGYSSSVADTPDINILKIEVDKLESGIDYNKEFDNMDEDCKQKFIDKLNEQISKINKERMKELSHLIKEEEEEIITSKEIKFKKVKLNKELLKQSKKHCKEHNVDFSKWIETIISNEINRVIIRIGDINYKKIEKEEKEEKEDKKKFKLKLKKAH